MQLRLVIFTGGNNSGKSAYLKKTIDHPDKLYIGVNRFYSFHHLSFYADNQHQQEKSGWHANMQNLSHQEFQNFENSFFNTATAITRLRDDRRKILFNTFLEMFGVPIRVQPEDANNEFSNRYISVGGESLSITSSGTRLFLGILAALMDERFSAVAIDEPELGLSPTLQRKLADVIVRGHDKAKLFPHNPNIILSTHSHLFLDRKNPENNRIVSKNGDLITSRQCSGFSELHDIQFRLLGNDLGDLFLPDIVIFVEGDTDKMFIERVLAMKFTGPRIAVQSCGGDIAGRLSYWAMSLGDMQLSPYRQRTIVIYDSVKQAGIVRACDNAGLPPQARVEWSGNGIEYIYPIEILAEIFRKLDLAATDLAIEKDAVSFGDISYKKMELCKLVCERLSTSTSVGKELQDKLLAPINKMVG